MKTFARTTPLALAALLLLGSAGMVEAAPTQKLLLPPDHGGCFPLPKFGFRSHTDYGVGEHVTYVRWGGRASRMGLEPGDLILSLNGMPLTFHGAWNHALRAAMADGGWVQLKIRDVRTGRIAFRETFVGGHGPVTPKSHTGTAHWRSQGGYEAQHEQFDPPFPPTDLPTEKSTSETPAGSGGFSDSPAGQFSTGLIQLRQAARQLLSGN